MTDIRMWVDSGYCNGSEDGEHSIMHIELLIGQVLVGQLVQLIDMLTTSGVLKQLTGEQS